MDPLSAIFAHDWATVGGWSLWIAETIILLTMVLTGRLRSNTEFKKLEKTVDTQRSALDTAQSQISQLIQANEIVKHFFQTWLPKPARKPKAGADE
jgi:hypothetical protein